MFQPKKSARGFDTTASRVGHVTRGSARLAAVGSIVNTASVAQSPRSDGADVCATSVFSRNEAFELSDPVSAHEGNVDGLVPDIMMVHVTSTTETYHSLPPDLNSS